MTPRGRESAPAVDRSVVAFAAGLLVVAVAYVVSLDEVVGLFLDDGWYVVLARALATGNGFTLINAPVPGVLPFYPPGFPALLALVMLVFPAFPANVVALKSVSVVAMLLGAVLVRRYFVRWRAAPPWVATGLALLLPASSFLHFLLTSAVLSEGTFVCVQMAALIAVERVAQPREQRAYDAWLLPSAVVIVAAALVRTIGIVLAPAAVAYVALRAGWRRAALLAGCIGLLLAPWQLHARAHAPDARLRAMVNDVIVLPYAEQLTMRRAGHPEFGRDTLADVPGRIRANARDVAGRALGKLYAQPLVERLHDGGALSWVTSALTLLGIIVTMRARVTVAELYVAATLVVILLWGSSGDRYLLPLLPLLAGYLLVGCRALATVGEGSAWRDRPGARRRAAWASGAVLAGLLAINAAGLARDVADTTGFAPGRRTGWRRAFAESLLVVDWVRAQVPRQVVLATHNPPLVFLYSGNPTVGTMDPGTNVANWHAAGARYWVDSTAADYRYPDLERSGQVPLRMTPWLRLGVYRLKPGGAALR